MWRDSATAKQNKKQKHAATRDADDVREGNGDSGVTNGLCGGTYSYTYALAACNMVKRCVSKWVAQHSDLYRVNCICMGQPQTGDRAGAQRKDINTHTCTKRGRKRESWVQKRGKRERNPHKSWCQDQTQRKAPPWWFIHTKTTTPLHYIRNT